jgi:hypothetical protein
LLQLALELRDSFRVRYCTFAVHGSRLGDSMNLTGEATRLHALLPKSHITSPSPAFGSGGAWIRMRRPAIIGR